VLTPFLNIADGALGGQHPRKDAWEALWQGQETLPGVVEEDYAPPVPPRQEFYPEHLMPEGLDPEDVLYREVRRSEFSTGTNRYYDEVALEPRLTDPPEIPDTGGWIQIGGDHDPVAGAIIAKGNGHSIEVRRIESYAEHIGREALERDEPFFYNEMYLDEADLDFDADPDKWSGFCNEILYGQDWDLEDCANETSTMYRAEYLIHEGGGDQGSGYSDDVLPVDPSAIEWHASDGASGWREADREHKAGHLRAQRAQRQDDHDRRSRPPKEHTFDPGPTLKIPYSWKA